MKKAIVALVSLALISVAVPAAASLLLVPTPSTPLITSTCDAPVLVCTHRVRTGHVNPGVPEPRVTLSQIPTMTAVGRTAATVAPTNLAARVA